MGLDNDDIKALIAILQKGLITDDSDDEPVNPKRKNPRSSRTTTKKKSNNKFDSMPEFSMCKEDVEIDKKIRKPPPSLRNRPFNPIKVQCRVCGKKEKVAPSILDSMEIERYKCNKCATGVG
jgi:hypothetical protein